MKLSSHIPCFAIFETSGRCLDSRSAVAQPAKSSSPLLLQFDAATLFFCANTSYSQYFFASRRRGITSHLRWERISRFCRGLPLCGEDDDNLEASLCCLLALHLVASSQNGIESFHPENVISARSNSKDHSLGRYSFGLQFV